MDTPPSSHHGPHPLGLHLSVTARHLHERLNKPEAERAFSNMLQGIKRYHHHPFRRPALPLVEWAIAGRARLLAPPLTRPHARTPARSAPILVCIPSLINGPEILDLLPDRSFLRWFAERGVHTALIDWGMVPDHASLEDMIIDSLVPLLRAARRQTDGPLILAGHCMGGTLAAAAACLGNVRVDGLVMMSSPWDFAPLRAGYAAPFATMMQEDQALLAGATIPPDLLQAAFALVDPGMTAAKFDTFSRMDEGADTSLFVAVEDWLNEGRGLPATLIRDILTLWYQDNQPMEGSWHVKGERIDPSRINGPVLVLAPQKDRVTPPSSATGIVHHLHSPTVLHPACGHIGAIAGRHAIRDVWHPVADWINQNLPRMQAR